jgi:hypothetical protein
VDEMMKTEKEVKQSIPGKEKAERNKTSSSTL